MATGDDALAAGMSILTGAEQAKDLDVHINATRDLIALRQRRAVTPLTEGGSGATSRAAARINFGITSGTGDPSGGADGDIYFKIV